MVFLRNICINTLHKGDNEDDDDDDDDNGSTRFDGSGIIRLNASIWKLRRMQKGFKRRW